MRTRPIFLLIAVILASACVSRMTVKPVTGNEVGFRYYLPKSYVLVTPAPDGTVAVEKVFLPDPTHEYAIDSKAYGSKYKLSVQIDEKGLLKKVVWNADSAESTKAAMDAAASLQKARIEAEAAAAKAADEKAKKAEDARAQAVAAVAAAEMEVKLAQAEFDLLSARLPGDAKTIAAEVALEKAKLKWLAAKEALAAFDTQAAAAFNNAAFRDITVTSGMADSDWPVRAWGPILYEVRETKGDLATGRKQVTKVELVAINQQSYLPSSKKLTDPPDPVTVRVAIKGSSLFRRTGKPLKFLVQSDTPLQGPIDNRKNTVTRDGQILPPAESQRLVHLNLSLNNDITADIDASAPAGLYTVAFVLSVLQGGKLVEVNPIPEVTFELR